MALLGTVSTDTYDKEGVTITRILHTPIADGAYSVIGEGVGLEAAKVNALAVCTAKEALQTSRKTYINNWLTSLAGEPDSSVASTTDEMGATVDITLDTYSANGEKTILTEGLHTEDAVTMAIAEWDKEKTNTIAGETYWGTDLYNAIDALV